MSRTAWIVFIVLCIGVLGGLILISRNDKINVESIDFFAIQEATADNGDIAEHVLGDPDAPVRIIEYGDYQCPGCSAAAPNLKSITDEYKDKGVALIFRNIPLTTIHPNALAAASAAEAAGLQGKFWEMHEQLYNAQSAWENLSDEQRTNTFVDYATSLGLDIEQFKQDMVSDVVTKKINFDTALAKKVGITGTPAIYVNGEMVSDKRVDENGDITTESTGSYVWADEQNFFDLIIKPELEQAGISVE